MDFTTPTMQRLGPYDRWTIGPGPRLLALPLRNDWRVSLSNESVRLAESPLVFIS
jgi:hypothetical protein